MFRPFLIVVLVLSAMALAHEEHKLDSRVKPLVQNDRLEEVKQKYLVEIKPIFERKCFDCHSDYTVYPWYYKIFGVKQMINRDIVEAKKHLDMTPGFPFQGHGDPAADLRAIGEVVEKNSMPPPAYRLMHQGSTLTLEEKKKILEWVKGGL